MDKYKVDWKTDGYNVDLPNIVNVPDNIEADEVADWLSNKYGWLVNSLVNVS